MSIVLGIDYFDPETKIKYNDYAIVISFENQELKLKHHKKNFSNLLYYLHIMIQQRNEEIKSNFLCRIKFVQENTNLDPQLHVTENEYIDISNKYFPKVIKRT